MKNLIIAATIALSGFFAPSSFASDAGPSDPDCECEGSDDDCEDCEEERENDCDQF